MSVGRRRDGEQQLAGLLRDGAEGVGAVLRCHAQAIHRCLPEVWVLWPSSTQDQTLNCRFSLSRLCGSALERLCWR